MDADRPWENATPRRAGWWRRERPDPGKPVGRLPDVALPSEAHRDAMVTTTIVHSHCTCGADIGTSVADSSRRISTHASSQGSVIYFRCTCGRPQVAVVRMLSQSSGAVKT